MHSRPIKIPLTELLLAVFLGTALLMFAYEAVKESMTDRTLTAWESHAITILVTATLATLAGLFIYRWLYRVFTTHQNGLEERERAFRTLADNLPFNIHRCELNGRVLFVNKTLLATLGVPPESLLGKTTEEGIPSKSADILGEAIRRVSTTGVAINYEQTFPGPDGKPSYHLIRILPEIGADGQPESILAIGQDVTERKRMEEELHLAASVFHNSSEGVLITDAEGVIQSVNPAFTEITGYTSAEALGHKPSLLRSDHHGPEFYQGMWHSLLETGHWRSEIWNRRKDGEAYLEWLAINAIVDDTGNTVRYVGVFHDITELRRKDAHIRHLAFHDVLTGLPNRALFMDRLEHAISRSRRERQQLSVTFIDIDGFKAVNDTLGHDAGDLLLKEIAQRISERLRRGTDTVARLGGDEFLILVEDLPEPDHSALLAAELIAIISQPYTLRGQAVHVGASMGIARYPRDGESAQELMKHADTAMYAAKAAGKGTYRYYEA